LAYDDLHQKLRNQDGKIKRIRLPKLGLKTYLSKETPELRTIGTNIKN
jgi:hypothetical protein